MKKRLCTGVVLLLLSAVTAVGAVDRFWAPGAQQVDGWFGTDWFGWVTLASGNPEWAYHLEHGWILSESTNASDVYMWCNNTGWCWFSEAYYPWMFRLANHRWLFYQKGSGDRYYDPVQGEWIVKPSSLIKNEMVLVEGGSFNVVYRPSQVDSFYISEFETTWAKWLEIRDWAALNGYDIGTRGQGCEPSHPVRSVSWYDVVKWCNARSERDGLTPVYYTDAGHATVYRTGNYKVNNSEAMWEANGYRLPTEAEWQFAAMGGTASQGFLYSGSNVLDEVSWYSQNSGGASCDLTSLQTGKGTWPVGQKLPNELGLHDMSGNVTEWCWDWHGNIFSFELEINPRGPDTGRLINRIQRGGGWVDGDWACEAGYRGQGPPNGYAEFVGFRVVRRTLDR